MAQPPTLIYLRVTGSLVKKSIERVPCDVDWTWFRFLKDNCKLEVHPNSPIIIRTVKSGWTGWEAKLGDTVKDFIKKFTYIRKVYTIRLKHDMRMRTPCIPVTVPVLPHITTTKLPKHNPSTKTRTQAVKQETSNGFKVVAGTPSTPLPSTSTSAVISNQVRKRKTLPATSTPKMQKISFPNNSLHGSPKERDEQEQWTMNLGLSTIPRANATTSPKQENRNIDSEPVGNIPKLWPEDDFLLSPGPPVDERVNDDNDDALSQITSASMEEEELDREGINNKEIKSRVIQRLTRNFDNATMLRIQHELMQLVRTRRWYRLTARAPRTGHLLQDIFAIYAIPNMD